MNQYLIKLFLASIITGFYILLISLSDGEDIISYWLPVWLNILYTGASIFIGMSLLALFNESSRDKILNATLKPGYAEFANPLFSYTSVAFGMILCYYLYLAGWGNTLSSVIYYIVLSQLWNTSVRVFARG